jgi:hypothetical protein
LTDPSRSALLRRFTMAATVAQFVGSLESQKIGHAWGP